MRAGEVNVKGIFLTAGEDAFQVLLQQAGNFFTVSQIAHGLQMKILYRTIVRLRGSQIHINVPQLTVKARNRIGRVVQQ